MNITVPDPAPKSRSYLFIVVALVIVIVFAGDMWYHFSSKWSQPKDIGSGLSAEVRNLQYELALRSNELAAMHVVQTNQAAVVRSADAERESAMSALRAALEKCRKEFADANTALEKRKKQIEKAGALAQSKDTEIVRLKRRIESLEQEMRACAAATNAVLPILEPLPEIKLPGDASTAVPSAPSVAETGREAKAHPGWLEAPGFPGMCRGFLRVACAPLVVPYGVASGASSPWEGKGTNTVGGMMGRAASAPLAVAVGSVAGAGGCVADTLSGTADICTMGYYGVRSKEFTGETDDRPAIAQLLDREEPARVIAVEDNQTKPRAGVSGQQTVSFSVR